jgi:hypothetical protein
MDEEVTTPPSYSLAADTTFAIQKITQGAYIESTDPNVNSEQLNTVLGETYSNIVSVTETISGPSGIRIETKLYVAYVSDTTPYNYGIAGSSQNDPSGGSIYIARFNVDLELEYIFKSTTLNTPTGIESKPVLLYGNKKLFISYVTTGTVSFPSNSNSLDISRSSTNTSSDIVIAGLNIFNFSDPTYETIFSGRITGWKNDLDILWMRQSDTIFNTPADVYGSPSLAFDCLISKSPNTDELL